MSETEDKGANGDPAKELRALILDLQKQGVSVSEGLVQKNQELLGKLKEARRNAAPPGSVVLTGDEAKAWKAYQELGDVKDIRRALDTGRKAEAELGEIRQADIYQQAARLAKFKPNLLTRYAKADRLDIAIEPHPKDRDRDGEPVQVPYVRVGDDKVPLARYAEQHWADDLDLLKEPDAARVGTPPTARRTPMPPPSSGDGDDLTKSLLASGNYGPSG